jgi:hypothetical protein
MTLYRNVYKLGRKLDAIIAIDEDSPLSTPVGAEWDDTIDHVRVAATVILPTDVAGNIHVDLLGSNVAVAGVHVAYIWGERCPVGRQRVIRLGAETLADAVAAVRQGLECDLSELRAHVGRRDARIQLREGRLAHGRSVMPPRQELVARFDVTGMALGEVSALAAEVVAQAEACEEHPDVTVRVEIPDGITDDGAFPAHCVDATEAPTARIRVPMDAVPEELDDWGQPTTPRSGPSD